MRPSSPLPFVGRSAAGPARRTRPIGRFRPSSRSRLGPPADTTWLSNDPNPSAGAARVPGICIRTSARSGTRGRFPIGTPTGPCTRVGLCRRAARRWSGPIRTPCSRAGQLGAAASAGAGHTGGRRQSRVPGMGPCAPSTSGSAGSEDGDTSHHPSRAPLSGPPLGPYSARVRSRRTKRPLPGFPTTSPWR